MKRKFAIILSSLIVIASCVTTSTYAWFAMNNKIDVADTQMNLVTSYFHCGSGTEDDPYVITRPIHLYNLSELYDKLDGFADNEHYFQLGYDLDNSGSLKFYDYNSTGIISNSYSTTLNMDMYDSILSIGSEEKPFKAHFAGNGLTIDNLTIGGNGIFEYVSSGATIDSVYFDDLSINVDHGGFTGYLASQVEDGKSFTNVYTNNSTLNNGVMDVQSDWGIFGYCDNAASLQSFINKVNGQGDGNDWGGSIRMKDMYNRLYDIADNYAATNNNYAFEKDIVTKADGTTFERNALTGYAYTYRDREEGSFVFTRYSANAGPLSNYMYLNGGTRYHQYVQTESQVSGGYKISYDGHYLGVNGINIVDAETPWVYENNYLYLYIDGQQYYLTHNLTLSTTTRETWTRYNNSRLYYTTSSWFTTTYHYITYDNGWTVKTTTTRNNSTQLTWTNSTYTKITENNNGADYMDYSGTNVTYFPLTTKEGSYGVAERNTGYVIAGSEDNTTAAYPDKTGDIRVSKYETSDINKSYSNGNFTNVYTISADMQTTTVNEKDYVKYSVSKNGLLDSINDGNIYGLHFMPANISQDHLVTAEYAMINGEEKTNYQMPASSIDFNLAEKGYINFFAGTYFSGNNSFFSLHHIERDENDAITSIKEIAEIYKSIDDKKDYIYKYTDNTYTDTITSDYSMAFSTARIKTQTSITTNAVYYFEIPVNAGEFALGSVDGGTGAYLMYLDLAANGDKDSGEEKLHLILLIIEVQTIHLNFVHL